MTVKLNMLGFARLGAAALAMGVASFGVADDAEAASCPADTVCAADPQTVVNALQKAGYKAALSKDSLGEPKIESAAGGYKFNIFFYDCSETQDCRALQFSIAFEDDGKNTPELANQWNAKRRFGQMSVTEKKALRMSYDLTTVGGLTGENFADVIDWWSITLSELQKFFKEN